MSYHSGGEIVADKVLDRNSKELTQFEHHIIQCCRSDEWSLRSWLRKVLTRSGFQIWEDEYVSDRAKYVKEYSTVHNMLAIRGENPKICLVAHSDVCRDHDSARSDGPAFKEYVAAMNGYEFDDDSEEDKEEDKNRRTDKVDPVLKVAKDEEGRERRIIQDRNCDFQVGGDDRLGIAINTWIAVNTQYPMGLYFPTDEEIGLKSARMVTFSQLKEFDLLMQVDRQTRDSDELVVKIGGDLICGYDTASTLLEIAYKIGFPRYPVSGLSTDVAALKARGYCKDAVNLTCGYCESHGSSPYEYIDVQKARETLKFCSSSVRHYYEQN